MPDNILKHFDDPKLKEKLAKFKDITTEDLHNLHEAIVETRKTTRRIGLCCCCCSAG